MIGVVLMVSACNVAYIPNKHNVPLMQYKGDASVSISTTNLQAAYAVSDHLAVMGNVYFRQNSWENSPDSNNTMVWDYQANRFLGEAALGYYQSLGKDGVFEVYGGGGLGSIRFTLDDQNPAFSKEYQASMVKAFIQPDIGYKSEYFDAVFSTRLSYIGFSNVDTTNYTPAGLVSDNLFNLDKHPYFFVEPAITLRFGYRFIKAYAQGILAAKLNQEDINYRSFGINVGIELDLGDIIYNN